MRRYLGKLVEKLGRRDLALIILGAMASAMSAKLMDALF
jgi:hypothetical protein